MIRKIARMRAEVTGGRNIRSAVILIHERRDGITGQG